MEALCACALMSFLASVKRSNASLVGRTGSRAGEHRQVRYPLPQIDQTAPGERHDDRVDGQSVTDEGPRQKVQGGIAGGDGDDQDRKSTRLNSSHLVISYA